MAQSPFYLLRNSYSLYSLLVGYRLFLTALSKTQKDNLLLLLDFYSGRDVKQNFYYGFHQLTEVALKALSHGINDPKTAVLSIHALADLFQYRIKHNTELEICDEAGQAAIHLTGRSFNELFSEYIYPIWDWRQRPLHPE
ncbi:DUF2254 family protein [Mucilaginibacter xinganensis]|uniref:DUF2254 family protein n=1 Tax=Mucilaginibacter xinganensis TaxID=1234841 RepID=UPI000B98A12E|nr:DUF2254 family protein [Mucilaginibacter xinganensis]